MHLLLPLRNAHSRETRPTGFHSLDECFVDAVLFIAAHPHDELLELLVRHWSRPTLVVNLIVAHVAMRALAPQFPWHCVHPAHSQLRQVLLRIGLASCFDLRIFMFAGRPSFNKNTLLNHRHTLDVLTVLQKGILSSIDQFALQSKAHRSLSNSWIDFFPVKMLLVNDGLYSGRVDSKPQGEIFDCGPHHVRAIDALLRKWRKTTKVVLPLILDILDELLLESKLVLSILDTCTDSLLEELFHDVFGGK